MVASMRIDDLGHVDLFIEPPVVRLVSIARLILAAWRAGRQPAAPRAAGAGRS
jgi:hypothetical protein